MPSDKVRLSDIEPARLRQDIAIAIPGTELEATLEDFRYSRGRREDGTPGVVKWAKIRFTAPERDEIHGHYPLDETYRVHGRRLYIAGSRSGVQVYGLPELPTGDDERDHRPL